MLYKFRHENAKYLVCACVKSGKKKIRAKTMWCSFWIKQIDLNEILFNKPSSYWKWLAARLASGFSCVTIFISLSSKSHKSNTNKEFKWKARNPIGNALMIWLWRKYLWHYQCEIVSMQASYADDGQRALDCRWCGELLTLMNYGWQNPLISMMRTMNKATVFWTMIGSPNVCTKLDNTLRISALDIVNTLSVCINCLCCLRGILIRRYFCWNSFSGQRENS